MRRFNVYPINHQQGNKVESPDGVFVLHEDVAQAVIAAIRDVCEMEPAEDGPETIRINVSDLGSILQRNMGVQP